jgi:biopolymer transport protein ExbD
MAGGSGGEAPSEGGRTTVFGEPAIPAVELNLTALMDILSNLLFFLLASFGATIVMSINAAVPVQSADKSDVADSKQAVTVNIKLTRAGFELAPTGLQQTDEELAPLRKTLPLTDGKFDYAGLNAHLQVVKERYPKSDTVILTPESGVSYDVLIRSMDAARESEVQAGATRRLVKLFPTVVVATVVK